MNRRLALVCLVAVAVVAAMPFVGVSVSAEAWPFVLGQLRVPRVLVGALVGAVLGVVGAVFQTVFHNPLATPGTIGTTAGAVLGATVAALWWPAHTAGALPVFTLAAFVASSAVSLFVAAVAARHRTRVADIILAGIACSLAAGAVSTALQSEADPTATEAVFQWSIGRLAQVGYGGIGALAAVAAVTVAAMLAQVRALAALAAGEEQAHGQGVNVSRVRTACILVGSLGVSACVAWCGPIAFVDLIVPHVVRRVVGADRRVLIPVSAVVGAAFLPLCDAVGRVVLADRELPVGVVTSALGAAALIWLLARRRVG